MTTPEQTNDQFAARIATDATIKHGYIALVIGPSGTGRSYVLHQVARKAQSARKDIQTIEFRCRSFDEGYEPLFEVLLSVTPTLNRKLINYAVNNKLKLAIFLAKAVSFVFPSDLSEIVDIFGELAPDLDSGDSEKSAQRYSRARIRRLFGLLEKAIQRSGKKKVLTLDDLEVFSEQGIGIVTELIKEPPRGLAIVAALNSESTGYSSRSALASLQSPMQLKRSDDIYMLRGKSVEEIMTWKAQESGIPISDEIAREAYRRSDGGRARNLVPWIRQKTTELESVDNNQLSMFGFYREGFMNLGIEAKKVLGFLTVIFPGGLTFTELHELGVSTGSVIDLSNELRDQFVDMSSSDGRQVLKGPIVFEFLRNEIGEAALEEFRNAVRKNIGKLKQISHNGHEKLAFALARVSQRYQGEITADLLAIADTCLQKGQLTAAREIIQLGETKNEGAHMEQDSSREIELLLRKADLGSQLGLYEENLRWLSGVTDPSLTSTDKARLAILRGANHYWLNQYQEALVDFRAARQYARKAGLSDVVVKASIRTIQIAVDVGKYRLASTLASTLVDRFESQPISTNAKCHLYRATARAMAIGSDSPGKARRLAEEAMHLARSETESQRDIGNATYALADVLRHQGTRDEADKLYKEAFDIGLETNNYDLRVYALLGSIANELSRRQYPSAWGQLVKLREETAGRSGVEGDYTRFFTVLEARFLNGSWSADEALALSTSFKRLKKISMLKLLSRIEEIDVEDVSSLSIEIDRATFVF